MPLLRAYTHRHLNFSIFCGYIPTLKPKIQFKYPTWISGKLRFMAQPRFILNVILSVRICDYRRKFYEKQELWSNFNMWKILIYKHKVCIFVAIMYVERRKNTIEFSSSQNTLSGKRQYNYNVKFKWNLIRFYVLSSSPSAVLLKSRCLSVKVRKIPTCGRKL